MAALAEKRLGALKRKLEAMQYTDALDVRSAPLVERLVEDLLHTTESYRALKIRNSRTLQDLEAGDGQVRPPPLPLFHPSPFALHPFPPFTLPPALSRARGPDPPGRCRRCGRTTSGWCGRTTSCTRR